jgi:hypothetical protein
LQPALWVEHAEVEDEHWLLWLLSPSATVPIDDPVNPCSAKTLFILLSFQRLRSVVSDNPAVSKLQPDREACRLAYQAMAYTIGFRQPALWVEQSEVEAEQALLWLLSPNTIEPGNDPVNPCNAKTLLILFSFCI